MKPKMLWWFLVGLAFASCSDRAWQFTEVGGLRLLDVHVESVTEGGCWRIGSVSAGSVDAAVAQTDVAVNRSSADGVLLIYGKLTESRHVDATRSAFEAWSARTSKALFESDSLGKAEATPRRVH